MLSTNSRRTKRLCEFGNCCTSMCLMKFNFFFFLFLFHFFLFLFFSFLFSLISWFGFFRIIFIILQVFYDQMVQLNQIIIIRQQVNQYQHSRHSNNSQQYHRNNRKVRRKIKQHKMSQDLIQICRAVLLE